MHRFDEKQAAEKTVTKLGEMLQQEYHLLGADEWQAMDDDEDGQALQYVMHGAIHRMTEFYNQPTSLFSIPTNKQTKI